MLVVDHTRRLSKTCYWKRRPIRRVCHFPSIKILPSRSDHYLREKGVKVGSHLCRSQIQGRRELNPDQPSHLWSMWAPLTWTSPKETTIILPGGSRLRCKEQFARFLSDQVVCSRARSEENRQGPDRTVSWGRIKIFLISSYALTASHHPFPDDTFRYVPMISQGSVGNPVRLSQCSVIS